MESEALIPVDRDQIPIVANSLDLGHRSDLNYSNVEVLDHLLTRTYGILHANNFIRKMQKRSKEIPNTTIDVFGIYGFGKSRPSKGMIDFLSTLKNTTNSKQVFDWESSTYRYRQLGYDKLFYETNAYTYKCLSGDIAAKHAMFTCIGMSVYNSWLNSSNITALCIYPNLLGYARYDRDIGKEYYSRTGFELEYVLHYIHEKEFCPVHLVAGVDID